METAEDAQLHKQGNQEVEASEAFLPEPLSPRTGAQEGPDATSNPPARKGFFCERHTSFREIGGKKEPNIPFLQRSF